MKLKSMNEMARAAKECEHCGQGPMSKTHTWRNGGWACKKGAVAAYQAQQAAGATASPDATDPAADEVDAAVAANAAPTASVQQPTAPVAAQAAAAAVAPTGAAPVKAVVDKFMKELGITKYTITPQGVDVDETVSAELREETEFPFQFGIINGDFTWISGELTTLKNCPRIVKGDLDVQTNNITSLEFFPEEIDGEVLLASNEIKSWKGLPQKVNESLFIFRNPAIDFVEHLPSEIGGSLLMGSSTEAYSLRGIHKRVKKVEGGIVLSGKVSEGGLGLMLINSLFFVDCRALNDEEQQTPFKLIDAAMRAGKDPLDTQEELIDGGFDNIAKL